MTKPNDIKRDFKVGDEVRLNSGGPKLRIFAISADGSRMHVGWKRQMTTLSAACITLTKPRPSGRRDCGFCGDNIRSARRRTIHAKDCLK